MKKLYKMQDGVERGFEIEGKIVRFINGIYESVDPGSENLVSKIPFCYPVIDESGFVMNPKKQPKPKSKLKGKSDESAISSGSD